MLLVGRMKMEKILTMIAVAIADERDQLDKADRHQDIHLHTLVVLESLRRDILGVSPGTYLINHG